MNAYFRILYSATVIAVFVSTGSAAAQSADRQTRVHQMAHSVMPFDISKTVHIFKMTETGGVQRVIAKDPDAADQIALIRQHLQHETVRFQKGNYSDPEKLHGAEMPGLKELEAGAEHINVSYAEIPSGAEIRFESADRHYLTAIHRWFGAQLSEHCTDARAE